MLQLEVKTNKTRSIINGIRNELPNKCIITLFYDDVKICKYIPCEHFQLYYQLQQADLLQEFIDFGMFLLSEVDNQDVSPKKNKYMLLKKKVFMSNPNSESWFWSWLWYIIIFIFIIIVKLLFEDEILKTIKSPILWILIWYYLFFKILNYYREEDVTHLTMWLCQILIV